MVCLRCRMLVRMELSKMGLVCSSVDIGSVNIIGSITTDQMTLFKATIEKAGLELLDSQSDILVESIKNVIIEMVHYTEEALTMSDSEYISSRLGYDYTYLSNTFSTATGTPIHLFMVQQKIEKVKELLLYDELTLGEIADKLHYSSMAHLSNQFKRVTGLSLLYFSKLS